MKVHKLILALSISMFGVISHAGELTSAFLNCGETIDLDRIRDKAFSIDFNQGVMAMTNGESYFVRLKQMETRSQGIAVFKGNINLYAKSDEVIATFNFNTRSLQVQRVIDGRVLPEARYSCVNVPSLEKTLLRPKAPGESGE